MKLTCLNLYLILNTSHVTVGIKESTPLFSTRCVAGDTDKGKCLHCFTLKLHRGKLLYLYANFRYSTF